jgi:hypothetical protein
MVDKYPENTALVSTNGQICQTCDLSAEESIL